MTEEVRQPPSLWEHLEEEPPSRWEVLRVETKRTVQGFFERYPNVIPHTLIAAGFALVVGVSVAIVYAANAKRDARHQRIRTTYPQKAQKHWERWKETWGDPFGDELVFPTRSSCYHGDNFAELKKGATPRYVITCYVGRATPTHIVACDQNQCSVDKVRQIEAKDPSPPKSQTSPMNPEARTVRVGVKMDTSYAEPEQDYAPADETLQEAIDREYGGTPPPWLQARMVQAKYEGKGTHP